jgi:hypothetical protein
MEACVMPEWETRWQSYCDALDTIAEVRAKLNYMDRVEKRLYALAFREAQGSVEHRKCVFYSSPEYKDFIEERRKDDEKLQGALARRDQLAAYFDLYRTDESTRREEMRLAR